MRMDKRSLSNDGYFTKRTDYGTEPDVASNTFYRFNCARSPLCYRMDSRESIKGLEGRGEINGKSFD